MEQDEPRRFEDWWPRIEPSLRRAIARFSSSTAFDTVQDVAVLALRNWGRFASYEDFARWCHVRAKWLALDELARIRRRPMAAIDSVDPAMAINENPDFSDMISMVEKLPKRQREVVTFKLLGYKTEEVARAMQISESAVRSHWRYAQASLSRMVEP
jgi:RNA polymerase sigma factor (sigma-70 family)